MNGGAIDCIADTSAIIGLLRGDPRAPPWRRAQRPQYSLILEHWQCVQSRSTDAAVGRNEFDI
jgi:hypothetical protein